MVEVNPAAVHRKLSNEIIVTIKEKCTGTKRLLEPLLDAGGTAGERDLQPSSHLSMTATFDLSVEA